MKIGIDASNLRRGGGQTHLIEVLRVADPLLHGINSFVVYGSAATLEKLECRDWLIKRHVPLLDGPLWQRLFWQRFVLPKLLLEDGVDLLFVPGGSDGSGFHPIVTMSRNMLPFEWQELRRHGWSLATVRYLLLRISQGNSFRAADGVVFLTQYARDVTLKALGTLHGKVKLIPHGVDDRFSCAPRIQREAQELSFASPLKVLYVSVVDPYKHQWHVINAVAKLRNAGLPLTLDLIGPSGGSTSMARLFGALDEVDPERKFINYHGPIQYSELHKFYQGADIKVFASSCENMPNILLESMAAGLPIACSNKGPMPEILGTAGIYFDPEEPDQIAAAIEKLFYSAEIRRQKASEAFLLAQRYSWKRCSDETLANLTDILNVHRSLGGPTRNGFAKVFRFVRIYGFSRTAFKAVGRLRLDFPLWSFRRCEADIAIVGCGQFSFSTIGHHLWKKFGNRIAICYDIDSTVQRFFENTYRVPSSATSFLDVLQSKLVKIIYIASNHASHTPYAIAAINSGFDVFIEKPVVVSRQQLIELLRALQASPVRVFAGYNRPFSKAITDLRKEMLVRSADGFSVQCFVSGHMLPASHWYRNPEEGTRICGNVGHWLDLIVHIWAWRGLPDRLKISLSIADDKIPDDNMVIGISSDRGDVASIMISSRCEPFEGINETINIQHHEVICKIDDFRAMTVWRGSRLIKKRYWPKDVGHRLSVLQPFHNSVTRDWQEVIRTSLLMLHITEMVRDRRYLSEFSFNESWNDLMKQVVSE